MKLFKAICALLISLCLLPGCMPKPQSSAPEGDGLTVHFIDVGQADCALLECDGEYILIDGGNVGDSSLVVSYLQQQGVENLEAVICSHAHEDHVGGLPGVLAVYPTEAVYAPTRTYSSNCFDDFLYYTDQQGLEVTIPSPGDSLSFGGATATVLGPVKQYADPNNTSLVIRVTYGQTDFLFTGDMELSAETDLLDSGANVKADVLKVGHHGSDTYRTDKLGHIIAHSDGTTVSFTWSHGGAAPTPGAPTETLYIGNTKSKKLHLRTCGSLPSEANRIEFDDYQEAIDAGYTPCSNCMN